MKLIVRGKKREFLSAIGKSLNMVLPTKANTSTQSEKLTALWLSPDEWMIFSNGIVKGNTNSYNTETLLNKNISKFDLGAVVEKDLDDCKMRFHSIFPESKKYSEMHDFKFYELKIKHVRWIGGFGKIAWLDAENWSHKTPDWHGNESRIIDHMNDDHGNTIFSALHGQHGIIDNSAKMAFISTDGYYIDCKRGLHFIQFSEPCFTMKKFKDMLIKLAKEYREFEL